MWDIQPSPPRCKRAVYATDQPSSMSTGLLGQSNAPFHRLCPTPLPADFGCHSRIPGRPPPGLRGPSGAPAPEVLNADSRHPRPRQPRPGTAVWRGLRLPRRRRELLCDSPRPPVPVHHAEDERQPGRRSEGLARTGTAPHQEFPLARRAVSQPRVARRQGPAAPKSTGSRCSRSTTSIWCARPTATRSSGRPPSATTASIPPA